MRKTKFGLLLVMCVTVLAMLLSGCGGGSGYTSNVDPAQAEKAFLSAVNKAYGTEFVNDESLQSKANLTWDKVDGSGKIRLTDVGYMGSDSENEYWSSWPLMDYDGFDDNAKFPLIEITEDRLKKFENPSDELLAEIKQEIIAPQGYKLSSVYVSAKKIGGRVYIVYVTESMREE